MSAQPTPFDHRRHVPALDGLRGVAILAVCVSHLYPGSERDPLAHIARAGWLGVDLFFVLSGFLITGILYDTQNDPRCLRVFFARRALRTVPLYLVVSLGVVLFSVATGTHLTRWTVPYFAYGSNLVLNLGKPTGLTPYLDMSHFWSLAVEEQFYLLWPFAVLAARTPRRLLGVCLAGACASEALRMAASLAGPGLLGGRGDMELPLHMDGLLLGGAVAMLVRLPRSRSMLVSRPTQGCALGCGVALAALFATHPHLGLYSALSARVVLLLAAICFAATIALALDPGTWVARLGRNSALRWLGRYSYGIYILHFPLHTLLERHTMSPTGPHTLAARAVSLLWVAGYSVAVLAAAVLSYHALERPMLRLKRHFTYVDEQRHPALDRASYPAGTGPAAA